MSNPPRRRRFLQLTGTGAVAAIAGCADSFPNLEGGDDDDEYADYTTAIVGPSQQEIRDLRSDVADDEIDDMAYQRETSQLFQDAIDEFETHVEESDELTIEAAKAEMGLYVVDGSDDTLMTTMNEGIVAQLQPGSAYNAILEIQEIEAELMDQRQPQGEDIETELEEAEGDGDDEGDEDADDEGGDADAGDDEGGDEADGDANDGNADDGNDDE